MSYHNDPYRVDYLKIYPCLKERPDVLEVLKKSDRKMKYMEVDLKSEQRRKNAENGAESYVPSKEDSLERLVYSAKCQFADDAEGVEDAVIKKDDLCRLRAALDQLSEEERVLIHALFFDERSERELEEMMGVHRMTLHNRKIRILQKLKKMLEAWELSIIFTFAFSSLCPMAPLFSPTFSFSGRFPCLCRRDCQM